MFQSQLLAIALVTIASVLSVQAQSNPNETCQTLSGLPKINATLFGGHWFQEIRAPAKNVSCVFITVDVVNNQTQLNVTTLFSPTKSGFLMNKIDRAIVNITEVNDNNGFIVGNNNTNTTYKILRTDYTSHVVLCGYTNFNDPATAFGTILTRNQMVNITWLMELKRNSSAILSVFNDTSAANITQSKSCNTNSAATAVPTLATLFIGLLALLKLAH